MFVLIDNYDSFTFNLVHAFAALGAEVEVHRNDQISVGEVLAKRPDGIILSPGPCTPAEAGICVDLVKAADAETPILGVCLGHQSIAAAFGGDIIRAPAPIHGKLSEVKHDASGVFAGINHAFQATRYHSLVVDRVSLPDDFIVNAETDDRLIMGVRHARRPLHGVQFHPESIASEQGQRILGNFLSICRDRPAGKAD